MQKPIVALLLVLSAFSASAQSSAITVVKILNFSCPVCRAAESQDAQIEAAAIRTKGVFVFAPIPSVEGEYAKERIYYASRKQGKEIEDVVRESLYRGTQDMGLPFLDLIQVVEWLKDDAPKVGIDFEKLAADARSPDATEALGRAASLASRAGSQSLPSYILVQDNQPVSTIDPATSGKGTSLLNMREEITTRMGRLAAGKK